MKSGGGDKATSQNDSNDQGDSKSAGGYELHHQQKKQKHQTRQSMKELGDAAAGGLGEESSTEVKLSSATNQTITTTTGSRSGDGEQLGVQGRRTMRSLVFSAEADRENNERKNKAKKMDTGSSRKSSASKTTTPKKEEEEEDTTATLESEGKTKQTKEKASRVKSLSSSASALGGRGIDRKQKAKEQLRFDPVDVNNKPAATTTSTSTMEINSGGSGKKGQQRGGQHSKDENIERLEESKKMKKEKELRSSVSAIGTTPVRLGSSQSSSGRSASKKVVPEGDDKKMNNKKALRAGEQTPRLRQLQRAILADDPHRVAEAISLGVDVNHLYQTEEMERTPLYLACERGRLDVVRLLVEKGADVNAETGRRWNFQTLDDSMTDMTMETPFHAACERGSVELIRYLLNNGADPNILPMTREMGVAMEGPIELCALRKNTEGVIALLEHGAIPTPAAVKKLKRLKKVNLSNKRLKKVPRWVKYFSGVERLDLSHNELTYLPTYLGHFSSLKKLLLDANPLESIPAEIRKGKLSGLLSYLRELDKSKGEPWRRVKLLFVGKENVGKTSLLQALQAFMAHSAPSATHSSTSLAAGSSSSSAIFFSGQLHYTSDSKITVKVSERQSQATTFMRTLSTDGIALGELSTEHYAKRKEISAVAQNTQSKGKSKRRERANVIFQTYDFGGQEVFYPTHQFFLTARSIYLVVFNAAEGAKATASIKYWVNQIRVSTKGLETPILLVGTHIDHPDVDTDALQNLARQLKRQDSNIREVVFVSSATGAGLPELVEKMISIAQRHSFLRAVIPTSYHRFYNAIINMRNGRSSRGNLRAVQSTSDLPAVVSSTEKEGKGDLWSSGGVTTDQPLNFISWDDLDRVARNCGITSSGDMHVMVSFFHDVGLLIHFEEAFGGLRDLVIINPQWLASVMKSVVSFSNKWVRNGILNEKQLHWVWLDFPRYLHPLLLRIFERFQIAFKIRIARRLSASEEERAKAEKRTGADIIVPSLLPEECPADALDREWTSYYARAGRGMVAFGRRYLLSFIPVGLFARLMVRILHVPKTRLIAAWRTGFVMEFITSTSKGDHDHTVDSDSATRNPCLVRAFFEQKSEPQNELVFFMRGHKDELSTDLSAVSSSSSSSSSSASSSSQSAEGGVVALLEKLVYITDTLFAGFAGLETRKLIPYWLSEEDEEGPADIPSTGDKEAGTTAVATVDDSATGKGKLRSASSLDESEMTMHCIPYSKAVKAAMKGRRVVNCDGHQLPLALIAPDVAMASVRTVLPEELTVACKIGEGGFGAVLKGFWHGKAVAVKQLHERTGLEKEEEAKYRIKKFDEFKHEAFIMSCLDHPNVVSLYGVQMNPLAMVMEYAPKGDLHRLLNSRQKGTVRCNHSTHNLPLSLRKRRLLSGFGREDTEHERMLPLVMGDRVVVVSEDEETGLAQVETSYCEKGLFPSACLKKGDEPVPDEKIPWSLRWRIALDIAKGLSHLHSFQPPIVHRDLRSPNIFLVSMDVTAPVLAKVGDFGLARHVNPKLYEALRTWQWLAPEVLNFEQLEYDERADIYSFAIVLWEMASRQTPFLDEYWERFQRNGYFQEKDCQRAIIEDNLRPTIPGNCPPEFADLIQDCWDPNPQRRPPFRAVVKQIEALLASKRY